MLSVAVDSTQVIKGLKELAVRTPEEAKRAIREITQDFQRTVSRGRLSGRPGLMRRTGSLARSLISNVTGTKIRDLEGKVGFFDRRHAMIARVHELGTVGKGGSLPDIKPRRAKLLAWKVRGPKRAHGKVVGWAFAKKVSIPPRLQFFRTFQGGQFQAQVRRRLDEAARRAAGRG